MLTRGLMIGKIVDDFASLKYQIETRNKLGYHDLSKICEDFIREILNLTYNLNLINLNKTRSNEPGLDLGDKRNKKAFQITAQKTSQKATDTLKAISAKQQEGYSSISIFILGQKQSSYSIPSELRKKFHFNPKKHIQDLDDLLRDIVLLDLNILESIYTLFKNEFRQVKIELEPLDDKGNFESSYYNTLEQKPAMPPKNAFKFLDRSDRTYTKDFKRILSLYEKLSSVPRVTREILAIIFDKGKEVDNRFQILPDALGKFMRIDQIELLIEINILEDAGLVDSADDFIGERRVYYLRIWDQELNYLYGWTQKQKLSIRTLLNKMDFSLLDE